MNNSALLHIVERLEGFLGKLPDSIRKPVLSELTPLKELFLQQRPPRFVLTGPDPMPLLEFAGRIFTPEADEAPSRETLTGLFRWQKIALGQHGFIQVLDARGADDAALALVRDALQQEAADLFFFLPAEHEAKVATRKRSSVWKSCSASRARARPGRRSSSCSRRMRPLSSSRRWSLPPSARAWSASIR